MSLFAAAEAENRHHAQPLATRMRPRSLEEFVGQQQFLGEGKLLWRLIKANRLTALLFYGPPGTGKTTLAHLLAVETRCRFRQLNAVTSGVKDLREVLDSARDVLLAEGTRTLLFIDEIHRFNKSQQDALLPDVEDGTVILVGATTSNPFFAVNSALVSRSRVFEFEPIGETDIRTLLERALQDRERGLGKYDVSLHEDAAMFLASTCDGDARQALSALEIGVLSTDSQPVEFTLELAAESVQRKAIAYDRDGDTHYDSISALIKSIRGSDADAGIYWLARMLEGGEDVRFLTRRLVILASEDIGNADPRGLTIATSGFQAVHMIGMPEAALILSQVTTYLASAPKSNSSYWAINNAMKNVRAHGTPGVPLHLRNAPTGLMKELDYGKDYKYPHSHPDHFIDENYFPENMQETFYKPTHLGYEEFISKRLQKCWPKRYKK